MKDQSHKRHIAKAITWRITGTTDTIILSWIISGNPFVGLKIGFSEVVTKMFLYYLHERIWFKAKIPDSNKRHLLKTITWRITGTIDTMILAWVISGNALMGLKIGFAEVATKMLLYYLHEHVWHKFDYGLPERKTLKHYEKPIIEFGKPTDVFQDITSDQTKNTKKKR